VFYLTIFLYFEIYFIEFPWESVFGVILDTVYLYPLENAKRILIYLKFFWYKIFVH